MVCTHVCMHSRIRGVTCVWGAYVHVCACGGQMPFELLFTWCTVTGSLTESGTPRFSQLAQETPVWPPQQVRTGGYPVGGLPCTPAFVRVLGIQFLHKCMVNASCIEPSLQVLGFCYFFSLNLDLFYFLIWGLGEGMGVGGTKRDSHSLAWSSPN